MTAPTGVRNYSNTAAGATLTAAAGATDTTLALSTVTGDPTVPFTAALSRGTANEEIVLVTAVIGTTATVQRGFDGTTAKAQSAGATFQEVVVALDFREANNHVNATGAVHGTSSQLVGVSDTQTLTNKTLTAPTISNPTITGTSTVATSSVTTLNVSGVSSLTTLNVSGAATVSGTLGVTGKLTASAGLILPQIAAPAGTASAETVWAQSDGGLYYQAGTSGAGRSVTHWGTASSYPGGALAGDTVIRSDLFSLMRYNGASWRQAERCEITQAQRKALATGSLYSGFEVYESDNNRVLRWDGSHWRLTRREILEWNLEANSNNSLTGDTSQNFTIVCGPMGSSYNDGVYREVTLTATVDVSGGPGAVRINWFNTSSQTSVYWPNSSGFSAVPGGGSSEAAAVIRGFTSFDGSAQIQAQLEVRATTTAGVNFWIPTLSMEAT